MRQKATKIRALTSRIGHFLQTIKENEDGGLMPLVALMVVVLIAMTGLAIDGARAFYVKDILQRSVDAAGLAAGHALDPADSVKDAEEFFKANFAAAGGVSTDGKMIVDFDPNNPDQIINISGEASINTTFMRLFGFDNLTVDASAEITRETRGMELVLVMDNTGSMADPAVTGGSGSKIKDMQAAAKNLITIVYGDEDTNPNLWAGVVPFVANVNVGGQHTNFLSSAGLQRISDGDFFPGTWKGCVFARGGNFDQDDTPPSTVGIEPFLWEDTDVFSGTANDNNWLGTAAALDRFGRLVGVPAEINEVNSTQFRVENNFRPAFIGRSTRTGREFYESQATGPNRGCASAITPLVASKQTINVAIDEMAPWSFGGTTANFGLAWGWRVLSPRWRGMWQGGDDPDQLPLDYEEPFMDKVIVLLTDGDNVITNIDQTSFGEANDLLNAPETVESDAELELDRRLANTCNNAKTNGVIIYTVSFGNGVSTRVRNLMQNCASNINFYFDSTDGDDLLADFRTIGQQLSNLRLSR